MTTISDFNLQRINTKELADNISATIDFGGNILVVAKRGSGKTTISKKVINDKKYKEVYMNLSLMERPDIGGYPDFFGSKNGDKYLKYLLPILFKDLVEGDVPCVALLDEVDKADHSLLAPLLELIQFRSINGFNLKNLKAVVMTGNLLAEGGRRPPLPLLDRTEKYLVEVNPQHWLDWGAETGEIHPSVSAFISDNMNDLSGEVDIGADNYSDVSPRSWHNSSRMLFFGEKNNWSPTMMMHKVTGYVGKQIGLKYSAFFEHYQVLLPIVDKIMNGEKVAGFSDLEHTKQLVICMMLCHRYANLLDQIQANKKTGQVEIPNKIKTIGKYVSGFLKETDPEKALISIKSQIGMSRAMNFDLIEDRNWDELITSIQQII